MLESYFEHLCTRTSLLLVRPAGKIPPSVNYTLLCARIMSLNHNEHKIMNVIINYNDKTICCALLEFQQESIYNGTNVCDVDAI